MYIQQNLWSTTIRTWGRFVTLKVRRKKCLSFYLKNQGKKVNFSQGKEGNTKDSRNQWNRKDTDNRENEKNEKLFLWESNKINIPFVKCKRWREDGREGGDWEGDREKNCQYDEWWMKQGMSR